MNNRFEQRYRNLNVLTISGGYVEAFPCSTDQNFAVQDLVVVAFDKLWGKAKDPDGDRRFQCSTFDLGTLGFIEFYQQAARLLSVDAWHTSLGDGELVSWESVQAPRLDV